MARQPPKTKRPARSRLQTCISGEIHEQVDLYCAHYGLKEGRFFELAALEKIAGCGDAKSLTRLLRRISEQLEIISEHDHLFLQLWLKNTQFFTQQEQHAARGQITAHYKRFIEQLRANLTGRGSFLGTTHEQLRNASRPDTPASAPKSSANETSSSRAATP